MYFLNKREIPHTTNFVPLLDLAKSLGVDYLNDLYIAGNAAYRSERFIQEIVSALGEVIRRKIVTQIQESEFVVLMIDETTDVAVMKQLVLYGRFIHDGAVQTLFLQIVQIPDGTAVTIVDTVKKFCDEWNLDIKRKICGLESDGASVMLGMRGGEIVSALGEVIRRKIVTQIQESEFVVLMIDETTDVAVMKQLVLYGRFIHDGAVQTLFLQIVQIPDGTAVTIVDTVKKFCDEWNLDIKRKLCGLGSDGASVMLGMRGGVATLLKKEVPFMIANHCIAHRLALACGQASDEVPYIKKFKAILDQLYRFYDNFPVRTAGLHSIQEILNEPNLKLC